MDHRWLPVFGRQFRLTEELRSNIRGLTEVLMMRITRATNDGVRLGAGNIDGKPCVMDDGKVYWAELANSSKLKPPAYIVLRPP